MRSLVSRESADDDALCLGTGGGGLDCQRVLPDAIMYALFGDSWVLKSAHSCDAMDSLLITTLSVADEEKMVV
jgi:hypothetical protein